MRVPSGLFYEQKTAYEWRISDWSSDVCSSDLAAAGAYLQTVAAAVSSGAEVFRRDGRDGTGSLLDRAAGEIGDVAGRLAERGPEEILHDVEGFARRHPRSEEHTSELQSLMRISYAVSYLQKKKKKTEQK